MNVKSEAEVIGLHVAWSHWDGSVSVLPVDLTVWAETAPAPLHHRTSSYSHRRLVSVKQYDRYWKH